MDVANFKNLFLEYIRKINENSNKVLNSFCEQFGLTNSQARILMLLHQNEVHTIGSLGNDLCIAGANISATCKKLEAMGLVDRSRDLDDERVVLVTLTEEGNRIVQVMDEALNRKMRKHLEEEPDHTYEEIITVLKKLNRLLDRVNAEK
ncbi:MAG: MarR family winged helix-turn-helix transcriptional regulator [Dehalobacterium sp.]|jgi:DNA-binding MarR family transcriptional regulator